MGAVHDPKLVQRATASFSASITTASTIPSPAIDSPAFAPTAITAAVTPATFTSTAVTTTNLTAAVASSTVSTTLTTIGPAPSWCKCDQLYVLERHVLICGTFWMLYYTPILLSYAQHTCTCMHHVHVCTAA